MRSVRDRPPLQGFTIEIPVRFAECDSYGVVWHGHYALYLEEVRDRLTGRFGFTPAKALALGYRVPVTRMEIRYRAPARPDQIVRATARLRPPDTARLVVDYELRGEEGVLLASAETEQVVLRADGELLLALPAALKRLVGEIVAFQDSGASL
ncbi:MAG TPA: acyl-CoA thioesterase [Thermoanaerobaculia bacterium]|jgi:acyl-CoA thioester hydrolase|nr:acyl-CoA thioesterase [Thermoanaerobaculia bacterium]HLN93644.1 acyl-CoA thioesterase [Thermoanaerobaculia bacterium]